MFCYTNKRLGRIGQPRPGLLAPPPLTGAEISIKLFFKDFCKNFRLYILINLKRKGKYLKIKNLNIIIGLNV